MRMRAGWIAVIAVLATAGVLAGCKKDEKPAGERAKPTERAGTAEGERVGGSADKAGDVESQGSGTPVADSRSGPDGPSLDEQLFQYRFMVKSWYNHVLPIVEEYEIDHFKVVLAQIDAEYTQCEKSLGPEVSRDPYCLAMVYANPYKCAQYYNKERRYECYYFGYFGWLRDRLVDWYKNGMSVAWCDKPSSEFDVGLLSHEICRDVVNKKSCNNEVPKKAYLDLCMAVQSVSKGNRCDGAWPEDTALCMLATMASSPEPELTCRSAVERGVLHVQPWICEVLPLLAKGECSVLAESLAQKDQAIKPVCSVIQAAMSSSEDCTNAGLDDKNEMCWVYLAWRGILSGETNYCDKMTDENSKEACLVLTARREEQCKEGNTDHYGSFTYNDVKCRKLWMRRSFSQTRDRRLNLKVTIFNPAYDSALCYITADVLREGEHISQTFPIYLKAGEKLVKNTDITVEFSSDVSLSHQCFWKNQYEGRNDDGSEKAPSK